MSVNPNLLELWYSAIRSPKGIVIETTDPERLKQQLYRTRTEACDEALNEVSILQSPTIPESHLWLVKKRPDTE